MTDQSIDFLQEEGSPNSLICVRVGGKDIGTIIGTNFVNADEVMKNVDDLNYWEAYIYTHFVSEDSFMNFTYQAKDPEEACKIATKLYIRISMESVIGMDLNE